MGTRIKFNEEEPHAEVYTTSKQVMLELDNLCEEYPDIYICISRDESQATYHCPKDAITVEKP